MLINKDELRWAAGFWDGEGTVRSPNGRSGFWMQIAQVDRRPLDRFHAAMSGLGMIYGPYQHRNKKHSPYFVWNCSKFEHAQQVMAMLWSFLCEGKRDQFKRAAIAAHNKQKVKLKRGPKLKTHCIHGHEMAGDNLYWWNNRRQCKACLRIRGRQKCA